MSAVWELKDGVVRLVERPAAGTTADGSRLIKREVLVYSQSNEAITSYSSLESKLVGLGWERNNDKPNLLQFLKHSTYDLISLPRDFGAFNSEHMYDIVDKNADMFEVRETSM